MTGKIFLWLLSVLLCSFLLTGFFMWRVFGPGPGTYRTTIELNHELGDEDLKVLGRAIGAEFETTCNKQDQTGNCIRWLVGGLGSKAVYVDLRGRGKTNEVRITSFAHPILYFGPVRVIRDHLRIEKMLVQALGDNIKSTERKHYN